MTEYGFPFKDYPQYFAEQNKDNLILISGEIISRQLAGGTIEMGRQIYDQWGNAFCIVEDKNLNWITNEPNGLRVKIKCTPIYK